MIFNEILGVRKYFANKDYGRTKTNDIEGACRQMGCFCPYCAQVAEAF